MPKFTLAHSMCASVSEV